MVRLLSMSITSQRNFGPRYVVWEQISRRCISIEPERYKTEEMSRFLYIRDWWIISTISNGMDWWRWGRRSSTNWGPELRISRPSSNKKLGTLSSIRTTSNQLHLEETLGFIRDMEVREPCSITTNIEPTQREMNFIRFWEPSRRSRNLPSRLRWRKDQGLGRKPNTTWSQMRSTTILTIHPKCGSCYWLDLSFSGWEKVSPNWMYG